MLAGDGIDDRVVVLVDGDDIVAEVWVNVDCVDAEEVAGGVAKRPVGVKGGAESAGDGT